MGDVDDREEHGTQPQRVALPGRPLPDPRSDSAIRRAPSRCASTVRPASTVSASSADDGRVPGGLRAVGGRARGWKYQRQPITSSGSAISTESASGGAVSASAPSSSPAHTTAIASWGTASRIALASRSMSVVIRDSRSPVPARSSTPGGSATDAYQEVLAQTRPASARRGSRRASAPCARRPVCTPAPARTARWCGPDGRSRPPSDRLCTSPPSRYGPTIEASTATAFSPISDAKPPRCRWISSRT